MSLLEEFRNRHSTESLEPAKKILFGVIGDLIDRKGFDNEWDSISDDIKEEILSENLEIIKESFS